MFIVAVLSLGYIFRMFKHPGISLLRYHYVSQKSKLIKKQKKIQQNIFMFSSPPKICCYITDLNTYSTSIHPHNAKCRKHKVLLDDRLSWVSTSAETWLSENSCKEGEHSKHAHKKGSTTTESC